METTMTRALHAPSAGVLLADQAGDRIDLLRDLNGDGDAADAGERTLFFGDGAASGFAAPTTNPFVLMTAADGAAFVGDGGANTVWRLVDLNGDGDAMDAAEATAWLSPANAAGVSTVTPNGLAQGPDGAIYVVNAGVASRPQDAIYRTVDLNGDGDADDAGETSVWLDLSTVSTRSAPFTLSFDGSVAHLLDPNGGAPTIWRIEDADRSGAISADEVTPFVTAANAFGAVIDFAHAGEAGSLLTWQWLDDGDGVWRLTRLTDRDGSGAIDAADEVDVVWNSTRLPEGFSQFAGFSVATDGAGRVALTSNGADPAQRSVWLLTDRNGDGDFLDDGETGVLASAALDPDGLQRPRAVDFAGTFVQRADTMAGAGNHFSLFLDRATNTVRAAGENVVGQLGQGARGFDVKAPVAVTPPEGFGEEIVSVAAGMTHGSFLTVSGDVYVWGQGNFGRLGLGDDEDRTVATRITGDLDDRKVVLIDHGNGASYAITEDGALWAWGQNSNGQLGLGDLTHRFTPTQVAALAGEQVVAVSAGTAHTLALTASGAVWAWGGNRAGQLGAPEGLTPAGAPLTRVASPIRVAGLPEDARVVAITADGQTSYAVLADGRVFGWGEGSFGQLPQGEDDGDGTFAPDSADVLAPAQLTGLPGDVIDVKGGARWAVALTASGEVWAWGPNDEGLTGGLDGDPAAESDGAFHPRKMPGFDGLRIVEIQTGPNSVIAVTEDGRFLTLGSNGDGRLGYPTEGPTTTPRAVDFDADAAPWLLTAAPGDNARDVSAAADLALTFTEAVTAGEGAIRLVNLDTRAVVEIFAADASQVRIDGAAVTVDPAGLLDRGARYAVEIDADAFRDSAGQGFAGIARGDASTFNFRTATPTAVSGGTGADALTGGAGDDLIATGAGRSDRASGGGGSDVFVFRGETANGLRETDTILDFEAGIDAIDLGGAAVLSIRETAAAVLLTVGADADLIIVRGVSDADDILFV
jgi:alpha-tubulin suppressor-like RCC1 family protein